MIRYLVFLVIVVPIASLVPKDRINIFCILLIAVVVSLEFSMWLLMRKKKIVFENACKKWLENEKIDYDYLERKAFLKGPFSFQVSDVQDVWIAVKRRPHEKIEYWFRFGGYFAGPLSKKMVVRSGNKLMYSGSYA